MDPVTVSVMAALLFAGEAQDIQPQPAPVLPTAGADAAEGRDWAEEIAGAARRTGLSEALIRKVILAESAGVATAVSPKGAMGLMQLMPETYREMAVGLDLGADPFNPRDNALAGAVFLKRMLDRFGSPNFLAAYNAGPQCMDEVLAGLRPLPEESRVFMEKVAAEFGVAGVSSMTGTGGLGRGIAASDGLFFVSRPSDFTARQESPRHSIFVPLGARKAGP
jgi:soluble lytic murein transglycosylase-like protein